MLDVAESENKQFCHTQAAALTLSAYFSESLTVSPISLLQTELEERVSPLFHHKILNNVSLNCHNIMETGKARVCGIKRNHNQIFLRSFDICAFFNYVILHK